MLGLADRGRVLDLYDMIMRGDAGEALAELSAQYADGADPMAVMRDLAEITHWISVVKITPEAADDPTVSPDERTRGLAMAQALPISVMTRMWQMLLKAIDEVANAPNAMMAAEMAIIRLTHVAEMPTPERLIKQLENTPVPPAGPDGSGGGGAGGPAGGSGGGSGAYSGGVTGGAAGATRASGGNNVVAIAAQAGQALAQYPTFNSVVALIRANRDIRLLVDVEDGMQLAQYQPGRIEFVPTERAPKDLAARLGQKLQQWTGNRWAVIVVNEGGGKTIAEVRDAAEDAMKDEARAHPLVSAVFDAFPKAKITSIRSAADIAAETAVEALPEVEDEWDPFEED